MLGRVWEAAKAALALAALIAAALLSADKLDRAQREAAYRTLPITEPVATGSLPREAGR